MAEFAGLVAVVTGGASGIGAATVALLAERGASVAVLDRGESTSTPAALALTCDISDRVLVDAAIERIVDELGGIDILVNNAGIGSQGDVTANDDDEWHRVLDVNVVGTARVCRAAMPHLRASEHAAIVNTCSVVANIGVPKRAAYAASKGAVFALTLAMATDHLTEGIRVNCVSPGTTDTPWVTRLMDGSPDPDAAARALRARQPLGRLISPQDVAHTIVFLASPAARSITGTVMIVDGGLSTVRIPSASDDVI